MVLRDVNPTEDTDFRRERLVRRHDQDLANGLGNLVNRVAGLLRRRSRTGAPACDATPDAPAWLPVDEVVARIDRAVDRLDFRAATSALRELVYVSNARINLTRPWELAGDVSRTEDLDRILCELLDACRIIGEQLRPFLPDASDRIAAICAAVAAGRPDIGASPFLRLSEDARAGT